MATGDIDIIIKAQNQAKRELDNLGKQLKNISKDQERFADASENSNFSFKRFTSSIGAGVIAANLATSAIMGMGRAFGGFIKGSIEGALSIERISATLPILAKNTGRTTKEVEDLVFAIRSENKSLKEATEVTRGIVLAGLDQEQALKLITVARDVGATVGRSSADVNRMILDSFQTLNPAMLKQVGISISLKVAYKKMAQQLGKNQTDLTTTERQQAILNAAFAEGDKFAGAYSAAMETTDKVLNSVRDAFEDVRLVMGQLLIQGFFPIIKEALNGIRAFRAFAFTAENELNPKLKALSDTIGIGLVNTFNAIKTAVMFTINAFRQLKTFLEDIGVIDAFTNALTRLRDFIQNNLTPVWLLFKENAELMKTALAFLFGAIGAFVVGTAIAFIAVIGAIGIAIIALVAFVDMLKDGFTALFLFIINTKAKLMESFVAIKLSFENSFNSIRETFFEVWTSINEFFTNIWANIKETAFSSIDSIIEKLNSIKEGFTSIPGNVSSSVSGFAQRAGDFIGLAEGGIVRKPTFAQIGENGPEAVIPLNKLGGMGGANITVNLNGNVFSDNADELGNQVGDAIIRRLGVNMRIG